LLAEVSVATRTREPHLPEPVDVVLRDGSSVRMRPVGEQDRDSVRAFLASLSKRSLTYRFFGVPSLDWAADWAIQADGEDRCAIVAETGAERRIVAHAAYVREDERSAEVAFVVSDELQGHGIATLMLAYLAQVAGRHGIECFTATVLPTNHQMIEAFRNSGFPVSIRFDEGELRVRMPTTISGRTLQAFERRRAGAAAAAVARFLEPRSLALVGASRHPGTIGRALLRNLLAGGYRGRLHLVNRAGGEIAQMPVARSVSELPEAPELAVIAVPAAQVAAVAEECGRAGVRALLVISAGFAELGEHGRERQRALLEICRRYGMRLIGPNCLGVINTAPAVSLNATFAAHAPPPGSIGFLSQSGGLGIALFEAASRFGLGISSFVSVGNKADISGNDLLEYWEEDARTKLILLYLESFGNPRRFARIARRVGARKPILAVKSGRTSAGARASASHTGAMLAASDVTVDALFRQAGVIRADVISELLQAAALLSSQPLPRGGRTAIVTNGGGPGIVCADACQASGLEVAELPEPIRQRLAAQLPPAASVNNPIDMLASASAEDYRQTVQTLASSGACDAIIALFVPPLITAAADVALALEEAARDARGVTLAAVFMDRELPPGQAGGPGTVPRFEFPEDAVRALAHAVRYARWRERPVGTLRVYEDCDTDRAAELIAAALAREGEQGGWLAADEVLALGRHYGLPLIETRVVRGERAAAAAASELGWPVALKAQAAGLVHKSDAGGVVLGLEGPSELLRAARAMRRRLRRAGHRLERFAVQPMAPPGVELLIGVVHDQSFGPVIACGAGGTAAELLGDVAVRITPLTDLDAAEMLRSLRIFPLLDGYRGAQRCDLEAIEDVLLRLSALVEAHPEVVELDVNPLIATPHGAVIIDARVRLAPAPLSPPAEELGVLRR